MKLIIVFLLASSLCYGQAKHSIEKKKDSIQNKVDTAEIKKQQIQAIVEAINFVLEDMKSVLYGKVDANQFAVLVKLQEEYIKEKNNQFNPPAKPNK